LVLLKTLDLAAALSLGLVMAHSGRLAGAQPHFHRALERIPRDNQLHQVAQAHVEAHQRGVPCPCDPANQRRERQATPQTESLFSTGYAEMMKQVLPEDLANKLEAVMAKLPRAGSPGMDPETARMLQEMEARTMQRLQGMMGMLKKPE
jgi:hypothetical protein